MFPMQRDLTVCASSFKRRRAMSLLFLGVLQVYKASKTPGTPFGSAC